MSFVGLLAAVVSEVSTCIHGWDLDLAALVPSAIVISCGMALVHLRTPRILSSDRPAHFARRNA